MALIKVGCSKYGILKKGHLFTMTSKTTPSPFVVSLSRGASSSSASGNAWLPFDNNDSTYVSGSCEKQELGTNAFVRYDIKFNLTKRIFIKKLKYHCVNKGDTTAGNTTKLQYFNKNNALVNILSQQFNYNNTITFDTPIEATGLRCEVENYAVSSGRANVRFYDVDVIEWYQK